MNAVDPVPGLVIRHRFLWSHEAAVGRREGRKSRPCAIIVAATRTGTGNVRVTVAPITRNPPHDAAACVEVPAPIAKDLKLDDKRQWLRFDELNSFDWPGFDLSPIPGTSARVAYGMLPRRFFESARRAILNRVRVRKPMSNLDRDE